MVFKSERGVEIELIPTANIAIFSHIADVNLVIPKPPTFIDDDGRVLENPFHPAYHDALAVFDVQRHQTASDAIIKCCVRLVYKSDLSKYSDSYQALVDGKLISKLETLEEWYIKTFILTTNDMVTIVQNTLLTEQLVSTIFNSIRVTRDGTDINRVSIKNAIQTHIETDAIVVAGMQLVSPLDEIKAAQFSMINWQEWLRGETSLKEKATAVALYRLDRIIETHSNDVVQLHQERESRKKSKH